MTKVIHQMWFQGKDLQPRNYDQNVRTWISMNPNWAYRYWDEESLRALIMSEYPEYFERWEALDKIIKKCDAGRYFILHKFGGLYADLDTLCHQPIEKLFSDYELGDVDILLSEESQNAHDHFHWKANLRKLIRASCSPSKFVGNAILRN